MGSFPRPPSALHGARRKLTEAILHAYANGEAFSRIAKRTGHTSTDVWNTLAVHGITRSTHLNGSPPA
ncbi:hypothetical protein ACIHFC_34825 [Streptomyces sp. NPDC052013]|uniref:hypothetical protein n=1 Tax=Streptomyces sp. NPDC052013 TaxID=3365679 RepID=UPI0037D62C1A